ncbi:MAG: ABC transporter substrate-binding protein [Bacteroidota bacterium]
MIQKLTLLFLGSLFFLSCHTDVKESFATKDVVAAKSQALSYAKRFTIKEAEDYTILELLGNKENNTVTSTFVLYKNDKPTYANKEAYYIHVPVKKVASMSSIYTIMLMELNEANSIAAIDNVDYYTNQTIQQQVSAGKIAELSKGPDIEIEKTLALNPDLLLTFGMGDPKADMDKKLVQAQLPIAISLDHLEETPLARAEWIKFVACFFCKQHMADSLFSVTETKYNALKELTKHVTNKPSVLTEIKYGDTWYVPSGKSYIANLIEDAGGNYFWKEDKATGSTPMTFEMVYAKAKDCDVWINTYNLNSKKELLSYDKRYALFKAYNGNRVYNNNKVQNSHGYSNYWETAMIHPDDVLSDLISVFYPELLPGYTFKYYKKLE